jgi:signal transduction histidine kinase
MLLNLVNNACDVSQEGTEIAVEVRPNRDTVEICVLDAGPGIPRGERAKIFEPFYTTKNSGCGLGLAMVKRFAQEANGDVICEQTDGGGTVFRVCLPALNSH